MAKGRPSPIIGFAALVGGAIPIVFTIVHLFRHDQFGLEDVPLWPSSVVLLGQREELTTFFGAGLFGLACILNVAWYSAIGWVVSLVVSMFRRQR